MWTEGTRGMHAGVVGPLKIGRGCVSICVGLTCNACFYSSVETQALGTNL